MFAFESNLVLSVPIYAAYNGHTLSFVPFERHAEKEGDRLNCANQTDFLEFRQVALHVCKGLFRVHFVMRGNPIRQFLC
jgi:hypothetical protein